MIRRNRAFQAVNTTLSRFHQRRHVKDPELRAKLTPGYEIGCKRILISNDWYRALAQPNVAVVASGVAEIRGNVVVASDGTEHEVDTIILGTGFEVVPPPVTELVHGRDGRKLADVWRKALHHYRAVEVAGFPNYFRLAGIGCGLGHGSLVFQIESQTAYLSDALRTMREHGLASVEVSPEAQDAYVRFLDEDLPRTVWSKGGCTSWYQDASGSVTSMWPRSMWSYRRLMRRFETADHRVVSA
jgi:cation diffusion facilitator CzcD-associated flavoprotein CzcO